MSATHANLRARASTVFTHKGNRPGQEDYALVDREKGIFVVADGFGGPIPGAEAAKIACESVRSFLFKEAGDLDATLPFEIRKYFSLAGNVLFNSLIYANRKVNSLNKGKNVHEKGGASLLASFIDGDLLAVANVGLCSASLIRKGKSVDLMVPRSFSRMCDPYVKEGRPEWQAPLIAMGMSDDLEPEIFEYRIRKGDWLIMSTDGIHEGIHEMIRLVSLKKLDPDRSISEILKTLNQSQFNDNATLSIMIL